MWEDEVFGGRDDLCTNRLSVGAKETDYLTNSHFKKYHSN